MSDGSSGHASGLSSFAAQYDADYYRCGCGDIPYARTEHWLRFFHSIAENIVRSLKPRRVLDAGCAKGFLVEALWERGVEAWGIDVSEYAISEVRADVKPYCRQASLADPINGRFDAITCIEVLEHIPAEETGVVIGNLTGAADAILFSSTPTDFDEPTHVNVRPTVGWLRLFAAEGFAPDVLFDATFIAPHAMLLRRVTALPPDEVLILFSEVVRYRMVLADRHRQLDHLRNEVKSLGDRAQGSRVENERLTAQMLHERSELAHLQQELSELEARDRRALERERRREDDQDLELTRRAAEISRLREEQERLAREAQLGLQEQLRVVSEAEGLQRAQAEQLTRLEAEVARLERENSALSTLQQRESTVGNQAGDAARARKVARRERKKKADQEITSALSAFASELQSLGEKTDNTAQRVSGLEARLADVSRQTYDILQSRIWRILRALGAMALAPLSIPAWFRKLRAQRALPVASTTAGPKDDFCGLTCDEPAPGDREPRTGKVTVSGWVLAESGIDRVEVMVAGVTVTTQTTGVRPDIARAYPHVAGSRTAGFSAEIDSTSVKSGLHLIHIRAFSRVGAVCEVRVPILIDHQAGFATEYDRWIAEFETRNESLLQIRLRSFAERPLISILTPVYRTPLSILRQTVESVRRQSYGNWELCLADDCSGSGELTDVLAKYAAADPRIKLVTLAENGGISRASNAALAIATGEFVAMLDHDDELAPDALYHVVETINRRPDVDLLYSDEDKIDEKGRRHQPFFKPDWSPDLLLSENYVCHFLVVRRLAMEAVGGFRQGFDGSQDYDLILRLAGTARDIAHIPHVLYHWRAMAGSTARAPEEKSYATPAQQRAIAAELERRQAKARVVPGLVHGRWRVRYDARSTPVSIIIASGGKTDVLRSNLTSLFKETTYDAYEVVVIDNSRGGDIRGLVENWSGNSKPLRYIDWRNKPFNYSEINNEAARHSESPMLLFLNDDTTVIAPGWLEAMAELAVRPEVGAVGAKLLYPDGRIQHGGVVMGLFENCGHAFKGLSGDHQHYFDFPDVIRNVSAVTGACLMTRKDVFEEVGGFDERTFAVAFNDIDLCLKIGHKGYRVLYTPHALLYHHEAFSKTSKDLVPHPDEVAAMREKWKDLIAADPFYSPNLSRISEDYALRRKAG